ncbi:MAG TPA: hypothetical protein VIS56_00975 [Candidatus Saccharimonadales bacterium]
MKKALLRGLMASIALVLVLGFVPVAAFAEEGSGSEVTTTDSREDGKSKGEQLKQRLKQLKEDRQENKRHRLEENRLKVCEQRKSKITAIMSRGVVRAEKQLELFSTIASRVKTFYAEKGRTLANYDELVVAVDAARADAEANLEVLKGLEPFDCSAEDPKGNAELFKLALKSINQDLKDYRTAVKDLIVGVKSAQSTATRQDDKEGARNELSVSTRL